MKTKIIVSFIILALTSCGQPKASDCAIVLKRTPYFIRHGFERNDSLQMDFDILKKCGELDSIDSALLLNESWMMVIMTNSWYMNYTFGNKDNILQNNQVTTYDTILRYIYLYKKSSQYTEFRSGFMSPTQRIEKQKSNDAYFEKYLNANGVRTPPAPEKIEFYRLEDIKTAIQIAKKSGKRALLYFSCHTCAKALEVENGILTYDPIKRLMAENFSCFIAHTDDKEVDPKTNSTLGKKFSKLQLDKFKTDLQPYFCIIDYNGKVLSEIFYTSYTEDFIDFLNKGRE